MNRFPMPFLKVVFVLLLAVGFAPGGVVAGETGTSVEGRLSVVWGDPQSLHGMDRTVRLFIIDDGGVTTEFSADPTLMRAAGGLLKLDRARVRVVLAEESGHAQASALPRASAIQRLREGVARRDVVGSQPWVSILCRFAGNGSEPRDLAYFSGMYDNSAGRLDHYWRALSYDTANVAGSAAYDWVDLPQAQSAYMNDTDPNLSLMYTDCTAAASSAHGIDFNSFEGINMMFNDTFGCCAWGGSMGGRRVTWNPPWSILNVSVIAHEMGHGFGLPHSNNYDGDIWYGTVFFPYDNTWDVMSDSSSYTVTDGTYGQRGKNTIADHKNRLGWIPEGQRLEIGGDGTYTVTIDNLALASTTNYRMVQIPIPASATYYTVEARGPSGAYDGHLPADAVIIHEVDPYRAEPAWLVDESSTYPCGSPPCGCDYGDCESCLWRVGETFSDAGAEIAVTVDSATASGFQVTIQYGSGQVFADGFESGGVGKWSQSIP